MGDSEYLPTGERSYRARVGITALNLFAPGLGLLRVGRWRDALLCLLAPFALGALLTVGMGHFPVTSYYRAVCALALTLAFLVAIYIVPAVITWRQSKARYSASAWSRWYSLTAVAVIVLGLWQVGPALAHRFYKPFYAPSASMAPTIGLGDKFIVDMRWRGPLSRGEVVLFQAADSVRVSRIAAVAGDRIAMRGGIPVINGTAVVQNRSGSVRITDFEGSHQVAMFVERFPDELLTHRILDVDVSEFDNTPEVIVPPAHFFVLGDNRDRSADSRVPPEQMGVGMVPVTAIRGRPLYIHWSSDRAKIGTRLDH